MIDGGAGDDMIIDQGAGTNVLRGGAGNDTITFSCDANNTIDGGSGNDLIKVATYHTGSSSYNSSNTFQGGAGNDRIESSNGTDTYLFNRGDGQDIISDTDHGVRGKADRIVFAAGISLSDVSLSRVGSHLVLKVNDPADPSVTDQITVENWFASLQYQIESFQFADGSTLSAPQVTVLGNNLYGTDGADTLTGVNGYAGTICGLGGNDTLTGTYSNDTLDGGIGLDTLSGGSGNDTYVLGRDYGADLIRENDTTAGNTDVAKFMSGIATDQIWLRHVGNNLEASIIGTSDKLTIENWYTGNAYHVEQFKTADGKTLLDSNVEALVQAMAAFAPPSAGQSTLPQNYQDALGGVIAANWQ